MRVLLCAATEMEIAPTFQSLSLNENHTVSFLITGVGLLAATYSLTRQLAANPPDMVVQAGVAGSLMTDQPLAEVVLVRSECVGDMGVNEAGGFRSLVDLKLLGANTLPWENGRLVNQNERLNSFGLPVVDGVTVNNVSTSAETIAYYRNSLHVQVETMEGAALHYAALLAKIPFLQLRSLSNFIGERDKGKWMMADAIKNLNLELEQILTKLEAL